MSGYTKLFGSIVASTIWRESKETKIVWITMLAMANRDGVVEASIPGLADMARVSLDDALKAIETLSSPDKYSRTKDHEGRRIQEVQGGWLLLNHATYRAKMNADDRREYLARKKRESRQRLSQQRSTTVNNCLGSQHNAEAEAEEEIHSLSARARESSLDPEPVIPTLNEVLEFALMRGVPEDYARDYWAKNNEKHRWIANGKLILWQSELPRWFSKDRTATATVTPKRQKTTEELRRDL